MKPRLTIILLTGCLALGAACRKASTVYVPATPHISLADIIRVSPSYSLFHEVVLRSGTDSLLAQPGPFTLLVPDNNAFAKVGILRTSQIDSLDTAYLHQLVLYSMIPKAVLSTDVPLALQTPYQNLLSDTLYFSQPLPGSTSYSPSGLGYYDQIHVNGDTILSLDTKAANGYLDVLSSPLKLPAATVQSFLAADTNYSYFVTALKNFGLYDQLSGPGPFTIIAPDNAAFQAWGITLDSINNMDTLHFSKYLFGVSILYPHLIFCSDFSDGPVYNTGVHPNIPVNGAFFSPDGILIYNYSNTNNPYIQFYILDPVTYTDSYYGPGSYYIIGPSDYANQSIRPATIIDFDRIAHNGVVHGVNNILIYPDSLRIK